MSISYKEAIRIAKQFSREIAQKFPDKITAVFAIGSLGSDYYRPGQSDIDTAVITSYGRDEVHQADDEIEQIADRYWKEYHVPKGFGAIVFAEEQLYPPYVKSEELILEILRLKTQARLLYGSYDLNQIPTPDKQDIIEDARSFQEWADAEKAKNPDFRIDSNQTLVNSTLIALKRYLMIQHNIVEFNKFKVISLYLNNQPPIVNDEVFDFINRSLHGNATTMSPEKFEQMIEWHDELYRVINRRVLYSEQGKTISE